MVFLQPTCADRAMPFCTDSGILVFGMCGRVRRVVLTSGGWATGDAAGKLIISSPSGSFSAENLDVGANLNVATIADNYDVISLSPNGRYSFKTYRFGGATGTTKMYGADGVNRGFEFDGDIYVPIDTGMTTDTPKHVTVFKEHLFRSRHAGPIIGCWTAQNGQ